MHIYIDESGSFAGFASQSLSLVGALCVPDQTLPRIIDKYKRLRRNLPIHNGEAKGKNLSEGQIAPIVDLLRHNQVIFEVTAVDLIFHQESTIKKYRDDLANVLEERIEKFSPASQLEIRKAASQIRVTSPQLFLQTMATLDLLQNVISHIPTYFAQRHPRELAAFKWIVDAKERSKTTDWEAWWSSYCQGALSTMSRTTPAPMLEGADYSYFSRFDGQIDGERSATDLKLLLADFRFSSEAEPGLELVDIVTNATRRALTGSLAPEGWKGIPSLMIHRRQQYISFIRLGAEISRTHKPTYASVIRHFSDGGRDMLSPKFSRLADEPDI